MNVFDKITVVVPSAKNRESKHDFLQMVMDTAGIAVDIVFIGENAEGLTTVYQRELENAETDIVIFIHDDIKFLRNGWGKEIARIFAENEEYGIIGIAGAIEYGVNGKFAWWESKEGQRGMLFHGKDKKSWFSLFSPYNIKSDVTEVAVVDGVFLACVKSRLGATFDDSIEGFHFYDIDFCVANFLSKKCKIGVTDRISVMHLSLGVTNEQWKANGLKIIEKYKTNLPIRVLTHDYKKR